MPSERNELVVELDPPAHRVVPHHQASPIVPQDLLRHAAM